MAALMGQMNFLHVTISCLGRNLNAFSSSSTEKLASPLGNVSVSAAAYRFCDAETEELGHVHSQD